MYVCVGAVVFSHIGVPQIVTRLLPENKCNNTVTHHYRSTLEYSKDIPRATAPCNCFCLPRRTRRFFRVRLVTLHGGGYPRAEEPLFSLTDSTVCRGRRGIRRVRPCKCRGVSCAKSLQTKKPSRDVVQFSLKI